MSRPLRVVGDFPFPPERYFEIFFDQAFIEFLQGELDLAQYRLDLLETAGDVWTRKVLVEPRMNLPWIMRKTLGASSISYIETCRWTTGSETLEWEIVTNVLPDKIKINGATVLTHSTTGCSRQVDGAVSVAVPGIGPKMEAKVVNKISDSYESGARLMARYSRRCEV